MAHSTVLGCCYYGERSIECTLGEKAVVPYRGVCCLFVADGAVIKPESVSLLADVSNALMAILNLIALMGVKEEEALLQTRGSVKDRHAGINGQGSGPLPRGG